MEILLTGIKPLVLYISGDNNGLCTPSVRCWDGMHIEWAVYNLFNHCQFVGSNHKCLYELAHVVGY